MQVKQLKKIDLTKAISDVRSIKARVGFFSSSTYEDGTPVAQVAVQNEFGVPQKNIPPRPFMRPALNNRGTWTTIFKEGNKRALKSGNFTEAFKMVAIECQSNIKENIIKVQRPALAQSTIDNRLARTSSKKPKATITKPLIDSGYKLNSVQYEVSK